MGILFIIGKYPKINHKDIHYQEDESYDNMLRDRDIALKIKILINY